MINDSRYLNDEKESILSMIEQELPIGSGFDSEWELKLTTPTRVNASSAYHCMNENGYYDGWVYFTVHFDLADPKVFKVTIFSSGENRARERKYYLREYLEDTIYQDLSNAINLE